MLRLRALGGLTLLRDGEPITGAGARRRPLAVLTMLAAAGERGITRAKLAARLWPESDEGRARNVLSQTLYALRRDLGEEDLIVEAGEMRVNPERITSDVGDFVAALDRGDRVAAVALYGGPFLDGFHLSDALEFERWVEEERASLARGAMSALESLAGERARSGDVAGASDAWRKLAALDPLNARVVVGLMESLDASGDPGGALQAARVYETLLREELAAEPHASVTALAERLRRGSQSPPVPPRLTDASPAKSGAPNVAEPPPIGVSIASEESPGRASRSTRRRRTFAGIALAAAALATTVMASRQRATSVRRVVDPEAIAILPFRVGGADPSLGYLREGMMDLLAATMNTERGPHAADPRSVVEALRASRGSTMADLPRDEAATVARRLGAGLVLLGSVVGSSTKIDVSASLVRTDDGSVRSIASLSGSADSLSLLVQRMTAQLLALTAGDVEQMAELTRAPLPALRAYVDGQAAYRRGYYAEAVRDFDRALAIDSSLALAAVGLLTAGNWIAVSNPEPLARGIRLAVAARDRLPARDRATVMAWAGPRFPAPTRPGYGESVEGWERAVQLAPDRAEQWYELGDALFHGGALIDAADAPTRATQAFERAVALDSSFVPALAHLLESAAIAGDTSRVRTLSAAYFARDSTSDAADFLRWRAAAARRDERALRELRSRFSQLSAGSLERIIGSGQLDGARMDDVDAAANVLRTRAASEAERWGIAMTLHALASNTARPGEMRAALRSLVESGAPEGVVARMTVLDALFANGDSSAARASEPIVERAARSDRQANDSSRAVAAGASCALELWRLSRGDERGAVESIARLRHLSPAFDGGGGEQIDAALCAAVLEAQLLAVRHAPTANAALRAADSLARLGRVQFPMLAANEVNLVLARLWEEEGDVRAALAAVRRRCYHWFLSSDLGTYLHEEARLAERVGDARGAARARAHLLALRPNAGAR